MYVVDFLKSTLSELFKKHHYHAAAFEDCVINKGKAASSNARAFPRNSVIFNAFRPLLVLARKNYSLRANDIFVDASSAEKRRVNIKS